MNKKPNFFIVGAPRCATTTVYEVLKRHPEVFMSPVKEPCFLSGGRGKIGSWKKYYELFEGAKDEKIVGEASTPYLYSDRAIENIKKITAEPRILIQLRDPIDRAVSQYKRNIRTGIEQRSFEEIIEQEKKQLSNVKKSKLQYLGYGFYSDHVKNYFNHFGRKNVKVILFEELIVNKKSKFREIYEFLGISFSYLPDHIDKYNAGTKPRLPWINDFIMGSSMSKRFLKRIIPQRVKNLFIPKIRDYLNLSKEEIKVKLTEGMREDLIDLFSANINQLGKLINADLSHWDKK